MTFRACPSGLQLDNPRTEFGLNFFIREWRGFFSTTILYLLTKTTSQLLQPALSITDMCANIFVSDNSLRDQQSYSLQSLYYHVCTVHLCVELFVCMRSVSCYCGPRLLQLVSRFPAKRVRGMCRNSTGSARWFCLAKMALVSQSTLVLAERV